MAVGLWNARAGELCSRRQALRRQKRAAAALDQARAGLALVNQEVERRRLAGDLSQEAMRLAAVMRLVIEEVQQQRRQQLLDLRGAARAAVADRACEVVFRKSRDVIDDPCVVGAPRRA